MLQLRSFLATGAVFGALLLSQAATADPLTVTVSHPPALTLAFDGSRGEPLFTPVPGTTLLRAVNASVPLILDPGSGAYYLFASDACMSAPALTGPWRETMALPASFYGLPQTDEARALREFVDARLRASRMRREPAPNVVLDDSGVYAASSPSEDSWDAMVHPDDAPSDAEPLYDDWPYYYGYGGVAYPWFGGFPVKPIVCHGKHSGFSGPSCSRTGFAHCGGGGGFKGSRLGFGHASLSGTGLGVGTGPGFGYGLGVECGPGFGNGLGVGSGPGFGNGLGVGSGSGIGLGFVGGGFGFGACR